MTSTLDKHTDRDVASKILAPTSLHVRCSAHADPGGAPSATIEALSKYAHDTHRVDFDGPQEYGRLDWERATLDDGANAITSRISSGPDRNWHTVALDVDVPVRVVPSSTPGHCHLYIDKAMPWHRYDALIRALADAGVVEQGYADVSRERGFTRLRLPWVRKGKA